MWMADPHVISALKAKRAELSGELIAAEKRIVELRDSYGGRFREDFYATQPVPDKPTA